MKTLLIFLLISLHFSLLNAQKYTDKVIGDFNVLFETNKADIKTIYFTKLDSISNELKQDSLLRANIAAHTDNTGSDASNEKLSQNRADALKNYLLQRGIAENCLKTSWKGEAEPISDNFSESGKTQNRRVVITVFRRIYLSSVTSMVKNDSGFVVPNAVVTMRSKYIMDTTRTDSAGVFTINVPYKQPAFIEVTAKDHFYDKKMVNLGVFKANIKDFMIETIRIGKKLKIKDLNFYGNKNILLPESIPNLEILLLFMRINPTYEIELAGHVNAAGYIATVKSSEYLLSVARAETVYNYLIKKGTSRVRMIFKGYANWEMLFLMPDSEEKMAANRRVEVRILKK
jgi:outer membrane protein OmpA-like peptidoglycan-associated protein